MCGVTVTEAYIHCAKALRRSSLWDTDTWLGDDELPDAICMLRDHAAIDADVEAIRTGYSQDVDATLWSPGGTTGPAS